MVRKRFTETPVEEVTEEAENDNDEPVPEESNVREESQIEQPSVKPKTIKQLQKEAENALRAGGVGYESARQMSGLSAHCLTALPIVHAQVCKGQSRQTT